MLQLATPLIQLSFLTYSFRGEWLLAVLPTELTRSFYINSIHFSLPLNSSTFPETTHLGFEYRDERRSPKTCP